jgi:hydrogenase-4 membrane subunit HyfE
MTEGFVDEYIRDRIGLFNLGLSLVIASGVLLVALIIVVAAIPTAPGYIALGLATAFPISLFLGLLFVVLSFTNGSEQNSPAVEHWKEAVSSDAADALADGVSES